MPSIDDKNDTEEEDMEQDTPESEKSDEEETESGTASEGEESSELDEEECDRRRSECLDEMSNLERQFGELKEQLYQERMHQVEVKLDEVQAGKTSEYLKPVAQLQENMRIRTQVAGILRELRKDSIFKKYESEDLAAKQNYESEKMLLYDQVKLDLEDKIRRLEEDRHNIDINSDLWNESQSKSKKNKKKHDPFSPDRRKKPVTVSGPYIVYMLRDLEIIEDWTTIKKALKQRQRKKSELYRKEKQPYHARYDDGKLFYEGEWYSKGHRIVIDNKEDSPVDATITAINTGEVWVKRADGNKSKLYIMQLQKGKYTIRHITY